MPTVHRRRFLASSFAAGCAVAGGPHILRGADRRGDDRLLRVVQAYAERVLKEGADRYGPEPTPLFIDGIHVDTRRPVEWVHRGQRWICSNLASQQNLFRMLTALSSLTGEARYRERAEAAIAYHYDHLARKCGLLQWGGHRFYDAATAKFVGEQDTHELKASYPYYELMHEVNPAATARMIRSMWNAHLLDWSVLDMNRHGTYDRKMGPLWESKYRGGEPFFFGRGLTFINTGSDLYYAAGLFHQLAGEAGALAWARRLMQRYVDARDDKTGLGAYQYSQAERVRELPPENTSSAGGDRAKRQLGPEFGERALEGKVLDPGRGRTIYGPATIAQLLVAQSLGQQGAQMLAWAEAGLVAYARHAYDPQRNEVRAMFTDGTPLAPGDVKRPGYYKPDAFRPRGADAMLFRSYALAHRLTGNDFLWATLRAMARGHGLGELGEAPGKKVQIRLDTKAGNPQLLLALLEIARRTPAADYLSLARRLAENIIGGHWHHGMFVESADHVHASFDRPEPLALLALYAHQANAPENIPSLPAGRGYIHGPHDGLGRTYDHVALWSVKRSKR